MARGENRESRDAVHATLARDEDIWFCGRAALWCRNWIGLKTIFSRTPESLNDWLCEQRCDVNQEGRD